MRFVLISQAFRARLSSKVYETTEAAHDTPGLDRVDPEDMAAAPAVQAAADRVQAKPVCRSTRRAMRPRGVNALPTLSPSTPTLASQ